MDHPLSMMGAAALRWAKLRDHGLGGFGLPALVRTGLSKAGYRLSRDPGVPDGDLALARLRDAGMLPRTVFDVGAAFGDWSTACAEVFPNATFVLLEPIEEYRAILEPRAARLRSATVLPSAASNVSGTTSINVHRDLVGSSLLKETEGGDVDGVPRVVTTWRLDDLIHEHALQGPFLLKVDVQGAELRVLEGAGCVLKDALAVLLEVSFMDFFVGGARFADIIAYMYERGFVACDIFGLMRRPLDGALAQADLLFVRDHAPLRDVIGFASPEQRSEQNARFQAAFAKRYADARRRG